MQNATCDENLNYRVSYIPAKKPEWEFIIQPLTKENLRDVTHHVAEIFSRYDPIAIVMDFKYEEYYAFTYKLAEICLERSTGVVAYEKKSGEFASALLCEDLFETKDYYPDVYDRLPDTEEKMNKWENGKALVRAELEKHFADAEKPYEKIDLQSAATREKYHGCGLTSRLARFVVDEHPIMKNAKVFYSRVLNPGTEIAFGRCGFVTVVELSYKDMIEHGNDSLEKLEAVVKERGLRPCLMYKILCLDRSRDN